MKTIAVATIVSPRPPRGGCRGAVRASRTAAAEHQAERHGRHAQPRCERLVALDHLEVHRQEEDRAEQREEHERDRDARAAEARVRGRAARRASGDERPELPGHERRERHERHAEAGQHGRVGPAVLALDDRPGERAEPDHRQRRADRVEARLLRIARLGDERGGRRSASATIGRLTRKTELQPKCSISQPPPTGPMAMPSPATAAQMPIAFGRSSAGKTLVRIESVDGMISAPPIPMSARLAISASGASGERRERASRRRRRPGRRRARAGGRSGRRGCPAVSSRPAKTRV